jgi:hypothetical protein
MYKESLEAKIEEFKNPDVPVVLIYGSFLKT